VDSPEVLSEFKLTPEEHTEFFMKCVVEFKLLPSHWLMDPQLSQVIEKDCGGIVGALRITVDDLLYQFRSYDNVPMDQIYRRPLFFFWHSL
jgi:hypothetical protein